MTDVINLPDVHGTVLWVCAFVTAAVFVLMVHSIATFRRAPSDAARPRNATAEVFWALVPIVIVIAMAAPAVRSIVAADGSPGDAVETAQQTHPAPGPELAGEIPQKAFQDGPVPL